MKCRRVQKRLSAFQDGELKPHEREKVANHLEACAICREQYAGLEKVWRALGELPEIHPETGFYGQLVKKINEPYENRFRAGFQWIFELFSSPIANGTLLLLGILMGTYLGNFLAGGLPFPFKNNQAINFQQTTEIFSLRVFDPVPPGTLGAGYLRVAKY